MKRCVLVSLLGLLFLCLGLEGCEDGSSQAVGGGRQPASAATGAIRIEQVLLRAVPSQVTQQRFSGFDSQGELRFGPVTRDKAAVIELTGVSTAVTRLQIEYLSGTTVIGLGSMAVSVRAGETTEIIDPPFDDVSAALASLQVTPGASTIANGGQQRYTATGTYADGTKLDLTSLVDWSSSNPAVATLDDDGLAGSVTPGQSTITASLGSVSATATLTVGTATITSITVTPNSPVIADGTDQQFTATATLSDGTTEPVTTASWTSGTPSVAVVDGMGMATAVDPGQTVITAQVGAVSGSATLTVTGATLKSLAIEPPAALSAPGTQRRYRATGTFTDDSTQDLTNQVSWSVSGNSGVTISDSSIGVAEKGKADISLGASTGVDATVQASYQGLSQTSTLRVNLFAYVTNPKSGGKVSAYAVGADGSLSEVAGSPFTDTKYAYAMAVDPSGRFVYVAGFTSGQVSAYTISADGGLVPIAGSPVLAGSNPIWVSMDPEGRYVYVVNRLDDNVSAYTVGADGGLTEMTGSPFAVGDSPETVTVDPSGHYAYVCNYGDDNVSVFSIGADGGFTEIAGSPISTGEGPFATAFEPSGHYAYTIEDNKKIAAYTVATDGRLTETISSPFSSANNTRSIKVDPRGRFLYAAAFSGKVLAFALGADGALSKVGEFATGANPTKVTVDPTGRYVYVTNFDDNTVSAYTIGTDGGLTELSGSPFATGNGAAWVVTTP